MNNQSTTPRQRTPSIPPPAAAAIALLAVGLLLYSLTLTYPIGVDWKYSYAPLSQYWRDPYVIGTFTNPPWVIALVPHAWLPMAWGNAVNFCLNIVLIGAVIKRFGGGWKQMLMVYASMPFLDLARTNNVDWIPMLGLLLPPKWGLPLLLVKPQALGGVALIWWKRSQRKLTLLLPAVTITAISFIFWGLWPAGMKPLVSAPWNASPWPYLIPLGLYMLVRAYQTDDEFLAAAATPFLVPYIAPYSIAAVLAFASVKYGRDVFIVCVAFWVYFILRIR